MVEAIKELQERIGADADGLFGKETITKFAEFYKISLIQACHFFAQCSHETGEFKLFTENLNYSASGLKKIFGKYFPSDAVANAYQRQPEKIANKVYASRMGNGSEASGEGYKFRGRGALQLTGKANYQALADFVKDQAIMENPDLVITKYAFDSALFFFAKNRLWSLCTTVSDVAIQAMTKRINGGLNGYDHRKELTYKFYNWVK